MQIHRDYLRHIAGSVGRADTANALTANWKEPVSD